MNYIGQSDHYYLVMQKHENYALASFLQIPSQTINIKLKTNLAEKDKYQKKCKINKVI